MSEPKNFRQRISVFLDDYPWVYSVLMFSVGVMAGGVLMLVQIDLEPGSPATEEVAVQIETVVPTQTPLPSPTKMPASTPTPVITPTFTPFQPLTTLSATQQSGTSGADVQVSFVEGAFQHSPSACSSFTVQSNFNQETTCFAISSDG